VICLVRSETSTTEIASSSAKVASTIAAEPSAIAAVTEATAEGIAEEHATRESAEEGHTHAHAAAAEPATAEPAAAAWAARRAVHHLRVLLHVAVRRKAGPAVLPSLLHHLPDRGLALLLLLQAQLRPCVSGRAR
jgi:hypothetical protein